MKLLLITLVSIVFVVSCLTSAYESQAGVPKNNQ